MSRHMNLIVMKVSYNILDISTNLSSLGLRFKIILVLKKMHRSIDVSPNSSG